MKLYNTKINELLRVTLQQKTKRCFCFPLFFQS